MLGRIPWIFEGQRSPGELSNLQGHHPLSTRIVVPILRRQALQKATMNGHGAPDSAQTQKKPYNKAETHFLGGMQRHCLFIQERSKLQLLEVQNRRGFLNNIRSKRQALLLAGTVNVVTRVMRKNKVPFILWFPLARLDLRPSRCLRP